MGTYTFFKTIKEIKELVEDSFDVFIFLLFTILGIICLPFLLICDVILSPLEITFAIICHKVFKVKVFE